MPTVTTVTVKAAGGDYTSLSSAEAGEQADLVSADVQLDIECYAKADTTSTSFNGWTTDATRYIRVTVPTAERHVGVWDTGKYRLSVANASSNALGINEDFVRIEGLQIEETHATLARKGISVAGTAVPASSDIRIDGCIIRACGTEGSTHGSIDCATGKTTIRNTIIYGNTAAPGVRGSSANNPEVIADNVTVAACGTYGFGQSTGTMTLQNCYSGGNTTDDYNGTISLTTCAHSSATDFGAKYRVGKYLAAPIM